MCTLETKLFSKKDLSSVKKALDDELGLDFEVVSNNTGFTVSIFDIESRKEINIIANIEDRFNAVDYFDTI